MLVSYADLTRHPVVGGAASALNGPLLELLSLPALRPCLQAPPPLQRAVSRLHPSRPETPSRLPGSDAASSWTRQGAQSKPLWHLLQVQLELRPRSPSSLAPGGSCCLSRLSLVHSRFSVNTRESNRPLSSTGLSRVLLLVRSPWPSFPGACFLSLGNCLLLAHLHTIKWQAPCWETPPSFPSVSLFPPALLLLLLGRRESCGPRTRRPTLQAPNKPARGCTMSSTLKITAAPPVVRPVGGRTHGGALWGPGWTLAQAQVRSLCQAGPLGPSGTSRTWCISSGSGGMTFPPSTTTCCVSGSDLTNTPGP